MTIRIACIAALVAGAVATGWAEDKPAAAPPADPVAHGRQVVDRLKCSLCHAIDGKGGKSGKPMNGIAAGKTDEFLVGSLLEPKKVIAPDTKMPSYKGKLTDEEVQAVVAYMKSLNPK